MNGFILVLVIAVMVNIGGCSSGSVINKNQIPTMWTKRAEIPSPTADYDNIDENSIDYVNDYLNLVLALSNKNSESDELNKLAEE